MSSLYVVSTPIGNLSDITSRAIETLKSVELILSEDTRETDKILRNHNIEKSQISYRDQNHAKILPRIFEELDRGNDVALVSDSGTPTISDPGFKLVLEIKNRGYNVVPIPGPSAIISSLSVSGLPTDRFVFIGFLPKSQGKIEKLLSQYGNLDATLIIYESPYRVKKLLQYIKQTLGNRKVCLAKDMTKMYEDIKTKYVEDFIKEEIELVEKGEYTVLIAKEGF